MEWVIVTAIVAAAAAAGCILYAVQLSKHTFICRSCSKEFKADWRRLLFAAHAYDQYEIRCPYCKSKGCTEKGK